MPSLATWLQDVGLAHLKAELDAAGITTFPELLAVTHPTTKAPTTAICEQTIKAIRVPLAMWHSDTTNGAATVDPAACVALYELPLVANFQFEPKPDFREYLRDVEFDDKPTWIIMAIDKANRIAARHPALQSDQLTALLLYTALTNFYKLLNRSLCNRVDLEKYLPALYLLDGAIRRLPAFSGTIHRAVTFVADQATFQPGKRVCFTQITSCARTLRKEFLAPDGSGTHFIIESLEGRVVGECTFLQEEEILLPPHSEFAVTSVDFSVTPCVVQLRHIPTPALFSSAVFTQLKLLQREVRSLPGIETAQLRDTQSFVTIAVFGAFSAGKSCFINAVIEKEVLPEDIQETTAVLTQVTFGAQEAVHVHFHPTTHRNFTAGSYLPLAAYPGVVRDHLLAHPTDPVPPLHTGGLELLEQLHFQAEVAGLSSLEALKRRNSIQFIRAEVNSPWLEAHPWVCLLDTPGFGGISASSAEIVELPVKADVVVAVLDANAAISEKAQKLLEMLQQRQRQPLVVINKWDAITGKKEKLAATKAKLLRDVWGFVRMHHEQGATSPSSLLNCLYPGARLDEVVGHDPRISPNPQPPLEETLLMIPTCSLENTYNIDRVQTCLGRVAVAQPLLERAVLDVGNDLFETLLGYETKCQTRKQWTVAVKSAVGTRQTLLDAATGLLNINAELMFSDITDRLLHFAAGLWQNCASGFTGTVLVRARRRLRAILEENVGLRDQEDAGFKFWLGLRIEAAVRDCVLPEILSREKQLCCHIASVVEEALSRSGIAPNLWASAKLRLDTALKSDLPLPDFYLEIDFSYPTCDSNTPDEFKLQIVEAADDVAEEIEEAVSEEIAEDGDDMDVDVVETEEVKVPTEGAPGAPSPQEASGPAAPTAVRDIFAGSSTFMDKIRALFAGDEDRKLLAPLSVQAGERLADYCRVVTKLRLTIVVNELTVLRDFFQTQHSKTPDVAALDKEIQQFDANLKQSNLLLGQVKRTLRTSAKGNQGNPAGTQEESLDTFPSYWGGGNGRVPVDGGELEALKALCGATVVPLQLKGRRLQSNLTVLRVERVQNHALWQRFTATKMGLSPGTLAYLNKRRFSSQGLLDPSEGSVYLFHGASPEAVGRITTRGFSTRHANPQGFCGAGLYFAEHISKSALYCPCPACGEGAVFSEQHCGCSAPGKRVYKLLLCRVALGDSYVCKQYRKEVEKVRGTEQRPATKGPPKPRELGGGWYDSVIMEDKSHGGDTVPHREVVIYDSEQVYPEYIIYFTKKFGVGVSSQPKISIADPSEDLWKRTLMHMLLCADYGSK